LLDLSFLKDLTVEEIERRMKKEDSRRKFEILVLLKQIKALIDKEPKTYQEVLEQDFLLALYYSALDTWTKALKEETDKG
jgi:hypothetical protein